MIDTLIGKIQELIIMESNPSMMSWLQEWKYQTMDMEPENMFELWEYEKEPSEDVYQGKEPSRGLFHLAESAPLEDSKAA
jgi:hypothetical protein